MLPVVTIVLIFEYCAACMEHEILAYGCSYSCAGYKLHNIY